MPTVSQSQYISNSNVCPHCGQKNLDGDSMQVDSNIAWQSIWCEDCGLTWIDEYKLTGLSEVGFLESDEEVKLIE